MIRNLIPYDAVEFLKLGRTRYTTAEWMQAYDGAKRTYEHCLNNTLRNSGVPCSFSINGSKVTIEARLPSERRPRIMRIAITKPEDVLTWVRNQLEQPAKEFKGSDMTLISPSGLLIGRPSKATYGIE